MSEAQQQRDIEARQLAAPGATPPGAACACEGPLRKEELSCPICFDTLADPFVTACGHTFCYGCICQHLQQAKNCPSCSHYLTTDLVHPNFLLRKIVKRAKGHVHSSSAPSALQALQHAIAQHKAGLKEADVDALLHQLWEHKRGMQQHQRETSMQLLLHFLQSSREDKVNRLAQLQKELHCLDGDIQRVEAAGAAATAAGPAASQQKGRPMQPDRSSSRQQDTAQATVAGASAAAAGGEPAPAGNAAAQPQAAAAPACEAAGAGSGPAAGEPKPSAAAAAAGDRPAGAAADSQQPAQQQQQQPAQASQALHRAAAADPSQQQAQLLPAQPAVPLAGIPGYPPMLQGMPAAAAATAAAAASMAQHAAWQHPQQMLQQQQQMAQAGGQLIQQQVADFAGAAFASLAAQAAAATTTANGLAGHPLLPNHAPPGYPVHPAATAMLSSMWTPGSTSSGGVPGGSGSGGRAAGQRDVLSLLRNKKRRIATQFDDLQQCYLDLRSNQLQQAAAAAAAAAAGGSGAGAERGGSGAGSGAGRQTNRGVGGMEFAAGREDAAGAGAVAGGAGAVGPLIDEGLQEFSRLLSVITRCNKLKLVGELARPPGRHSSSSIISSLECDKEGSLFATAGVSKRISVYEFSSVLPFPGPVLSGHTSGPQHSTGGSACGVGSSSHSQAAPLLELVTRSKLSCLSWNKYVQAHIASSDYEGAVNVWDLSTGGLLHEYEAHSKRIWSVDFCEADPTLLASGSDDCAVKLWSTKSAASLARIDTKANVCAVRWRPGSSHELAVGSADHSVYLYDMRHAAQPLRTFQGHRKAVSYVRFCNAGELVSASTDSTLRLWGLEAGAEAEAREGENAGAQRVYEGHTNEKNFVGLAVEGDFLACGSETSELYVYYKALSKPVAQQAFATAGEEGGAGGVEQHSDKAFISAICWRPQAQTLLAANSQGVVKIFSLTGSTQM